MPDQQPRLQACNAEMTADGGCPPEGPVVQIVCRVTFFDGKEFQTKDLICDFPADGMATEVAKAYAMQLGDRSGVIL